MSARIKVLMGHVAGWCIVVLFVVLLTLIFSFLGTIICAALAGMMMGSARLARRHCLMASLLFPAVISIVLTVSRTEIPARQVMLLSSLCFGSYWAVYLMMFALVSPGQPAALKGSPSPSTRPAVQHDSVQISAEPLAPGCANTCDLTLASLQGVWFARKEVKEEEALREKILEIQNQTVVLSILDSRGEVRSKARGQLKLMGGVPEPGALRLPAGGETLLEFVI